jgi:hypothetical protein
MGSRARNRANARNEALEECQRWADRGREGAVQVECSLLPSASSPAAMPSLFSYTHRPARRGPRGPAGSWVDFPIPQNSSVLVLLKMGSRARNRADGPGGPPEPLHMCRGAPRAAYPVPPRPPTLCRPRPHALHLPPSSHPPSQPAYPIPPRSPTLYRPPSSHPPSQTTYPIPPDRLPYTARLPRTRPPRPPTLCLPGRLPYTALVPLLPAPPSYVPHSPTLAKLTR